MKLAELKTKFKNKYMIRIIAGVLTVAVVGSSATVYNLYAAKSDDTAATATKTESTANTDSAEDLLDSVLKDETDSEDKTVGKEETVYVIADATGKAKNTIVSEWLKNPEGKDTLEDESDLQDIKNVKGDETFDQTGSTLSWKADGNDIYYQGTTTKETPVTENITYYLDDEEIAPDKLAGKSGKVKIRLDYTNNEKDGDIYVPFMVVSGTILNDNFKNVEVTNGKVISNGNGTMVMGVALPGLKESLQVDDSDFADDVTIPDYVEITADVENFELGMMMSVVSSCSEFTADKSLDLSEIDDKVNEITDAMKQLEDGSGELSDGLDTLNEKMGEFSTGVNTLKDGISEYTKGAKTLADGIGSLKEKSSTLSDGVTQLQSSVNTLNSGVAVLDKALNTAMSDTEKKSASKTAKAAAEKAVETQFADDTNPQGYQKIKETAASQFYNTLVSDANITAVKQQADATITAQADQISKQAQSAAAAQLSSDQNMQQQFAQLGNAVQAATQMQYLQTAAGQQAVVDQVTAMTQQFKAAGFTDAQLAAMKDVLSAAAQANVMMNDSNAKQAGAAAAASVTETLKQAITTSAGTVAVATAKQVAPQTAEATARGVAEQAKGTVGTSVADSVKAAAKTAAGTAAAQAAIEGAESAKTQIAQSIEKTDEKTGYSLVSGMDALNTAVNGMAGKMPELMSGIDLLYTGGQTLASKNTELNNGVAKLADGKDQLTEGVGKLADGSKELADGIMEFDEKGIEKLVNAYKGDIKPFADRLQKVIDAGKTYESFAGKSEQTTGSVKFIIKTEEVKP